MVNIYIENENNEKKAAYIQTIAYRNKVCSESKLIFMSIENFFSINVVSFNAAAFRCIHGAFKKSQSKSESLSSVSPTYFSIVALPLHLPGTLI